MGPAQPPAAEELCVHQLGTLGKRTGTCGVSCAGNASHSLCTAIKKKKNEVMKELSEA